MRKMLALLAVLTSAAGAALGPGPATAGPPASERGGWAVASFDPLPALVAGEDAEVSFRLLQHGVTPVDPAEWPGIEDAVGLDVSSAAGSRFVAARAGATGGRFTVAFEVPATDTVTIEARWIGGLVVQSAPVELPVTEPGAGPAGPGRTWLAAGLAAVGVAGMALAALDAVRPRRRTRPAPVPS